MPLNANSPRPFITFNDNKLAWCQTASAYLQLAQNSTDKTLALTTVNRLFPEHNNNTQKLTFPIDEIKSIFVNTLKSMQLQNSELNLHDLDTLSARLLLNDLVTNKSYPSKIICGRGSHSKISHRHTMAKLVEDHLKQNRYYNLALG